MGKVSFEHPEKSFNKLTDPMDQAALSPIVSSFECVAGSDGDTLSNVSQEGSTVEIVFDGVMNEGQRDVFAHLKDLVIY